MCSAGAAQLLRAETTRQADAFLVEFGVELLFTRVRHTSYGLQPCLRAGELCSRAGAGEIPSSLAAEFEANSSSFCSV
jgi:hypothetical protein